MNCAVSKGLASTAALALAFVMLGGVKESPSMATQQAASPATRAAEPPRTAPALAFVRPGLWQVTSDEAGVAPRRLCVEDAAALVQVRHGDGACSRLVIASGERDATVHYSCPGAGWGRTSLRVEGAETVRIDTQGIADSAPFAFRAEARRAGACGAAAR